MRINISSWKEFRIGDYFDIKPTKAINGLSVDDCTGKGVPLIVNSAENNGVAGFCDREATEEGNIITFSDTTEGNTFFYQPEPFIGFAHVQGMYPKTRAWSSYELLFFSAVLMFNSKDRFSYGRKMRRDIILDTRIKLPQTSDGTPDWQFMEDYIKSLHYKPIKTGNFSCNELNTNNWKFFYLVDICRVSMGNKLDYSAMTTEIGQVNFVGRSDNNNGVADKVDLIDGIPPYDAGCLSVALGGSLGACFYQDEPFYTSQNVAVLEFESNVSKYAKIFIACLVKNESRYKYFPFGRELNTHIRTDFGFTLPVLHNGNEPIIDNTHKYHPKGYIPDWQYMEDYIKRLPYGDRI